VFSFGSTGTDTRFIPSRLEVLDPGDFFSSIYEHEISLGLVWVIIDYNIIYLLGLSYMMLQFILHNWGDDDCIKVLKNCKKALPENGKVLIYEIVMHPNGRWAQMMDIMMLTAFESGMERTEQQWRTLIVAAGFSSINFIEVNHEQWLIEVSN
jgi:hypothetical protein